MGDARRAPYERLAAAIAVGNRRGEEASKLLYADSAAVVRVLWVVLWREEKTKSYWVSTPPGQRRSLRRRSGKVAHVIANVRIPKLEAIGVVKASGGKKRAGVVVDVGRRGGRSDREFTCRSDAATLLHDIPIEAQASPHADAGSRRASGAMG